MALRVSYEGFRVSYEGLRVSYEGFTETEWTKLDIYVFICNTMFRTLAEKTRGIHSLISFPEGVEIGHMNYILYNYVLCLYPGLSF